MKIKTCTECGCECKVFENDIVNHITDDGDIDYDRDGDHVALPECDE